MDNLIHNTEYLINELDIDFDQFYQELLETTNKAFGIDLLDTVGANFPMVRQQGPLQYSATGGTERDDSKNIRES